MSSTSTPLHLFDGYGIEIEHMIVARDGLAVRPISDELMKAVAGEYVSDVEDGPIAWSNEIVLHVIELKTNGPAASLAGLGEAFEADVRRIGSILEPMGARLLGTGMHPLMDPTTETRLWPHDCSPVYQAYDRIHGCAGHGWSNLQSMHINLPFTGDDEFGRLHAAIRAILPLLPALAASSPVVEGRVTGLRDTRLEVYRTNQKKTPLATGRVIPEQAWTRAQYDEQIFAPLYRQIAPLDPDGVLRFEFLNSRGAIARFDRDAIEIRVLDTQESPIADLGIAWLVCETVRALATERWAPLADVQVLDGAPLAELLLATIRDAEAVVVTDTALLRVLGVPKGTRSLSASEVWWHLFESIFPAPPEGGSRPHAAVRSILAHGSLATRLLRALGSAPSPGRIREVYTDVADCLPEGRSFGV